MTTTANRKARMFHATPRTTVSRRGTPPPVHAISTATTAPTTATIQMLGPSTIATTG